MQEKSENYSEFSERTEVLSREIGVNISDLPKKIGVSNSMFHAYRSGNYPISAKAWRKLEAAELAAGIVAGKDESAESSVNPKQSATIALEKLEELERQVEELRGDFDQLHSSGLERLDARGIRPLDVIDEIRAIAKRIGKWPIPPEDGAKQPWLVLAEYREIEEARPTNIIQGRGKSA